MANRRLCIIHSAVAQDGASPVRPPAQPAATDERPRAGYKRSGETRARILEAALAEACEVGFQKTSVARVAARAGVAVGVLNYHFGSKRELMRRLMVSVHRELWEHAEPP